MGGKWQSVLDRGLAGMGAGAAVKLWLPGRLQELLRPRYAYWNVFAA